MTLWRDASSGGGAPPPDSSDLMRDLQDEILAALPKHLRDEITAATPCLPDIPTPPGMISLPSPARTDGAPLLLPLTLPLEPFAQIPCLEAKAWGPLGPLKTSSLTIARDGGFASFAVHLPLEDAPGGAPVLLTATLAEGAQPMRLHRILALSAGMHTELARLDPATCAAVLNDLEGCLTLAATDPGPTAAVLEHLRQWAEGNGLSWTMSGLRELRSQVLGEGAASATDLLSPWTLAFRDPALEQRFRLHDFTRRRESVIKALKLHMLFLVINTIGNGAAIPLLLQYITVMWVALAAVQRASTPVHFFAAVVGFMATGKLLVAPGFIMYRLKHHPPPPSHQSIVAFTAVFQTIYHFALLLFGYRPAPIASFGLLACLLEVLFILRVRQVGQIEFDPAVRAGAQATFEGLFPLTHSFLFVLIAAAAGCMYWIERRHRLTFANRTRTLARLSSNKINSC